MSSVAVEKSDLVIVLVQGKVKKIFAKDAMLQILEMNYDDDPSKVAPSSVSLVKSVIDAEGIPGEIRDDLGRRLSPDQMHELMCRFNARQAREADLVFA